MTHWLGGGSDPDPKRYAWCSYQLSYQRTDNCSQEFADTSDAAYEKRHRKYETFEKRQRLREKEKLKHEQYKLKERIDQLRGMDYSAFLALPAAALTDLSDVSKAENLDVANTMDTGIAELPGAHVNGAAAYNEGERRRKEMLDVALALEERYRVLLPPDRKWLEKKDKDKAAKKEAVDEPEEDGTENEYAEEIVKPQPVTRKEHRSPVKKEVQAQPPPQQQVVTEPPKQHSDGESEVDFEERDRLRSKQLKLRIKFPARPSATPTDSTKPSPSPMKKPSSPLIKVMSQSPADAFPSSLSVLDSISPAQVRNISAKSGIVIRSKDGKFLPKNKRFIQDSAAPAESISAPPAFSKATPPPRKRPRTESAVPRASPSISLTLKSSQYLQNSSASTGAATSSGKCVLMVSAMRSSLLPNSRKTQRHVTAFGTRVPPEIEEVRDFEIPKWLLPSPRGSEDNIGDEYDGPIEHGSAYGYSISANGVGSSVGVRGDSASAIGYGYGEEEAIESEDEESHPNDRHGAKEEDLDELMDWQSAGEHVLDVDDDIPPIATLNEE